MPVTRSLSSRRASAFAGVAGGVAGVIVAAGDELDVGAVARGLDGVAKFGEGFGEGGGSAGAPRALAGAVEGGFERQHAGGPLVVQARARDGVCGGVAEDEDVEEDL